MYSNYLFIYVFIYLFFFYFYLLIYLFDLRIIFWVGKFQLALEFQQHSRGGRSEVCGLYSYDPNNIYIYDTLPQTMHKFLRNIWERFSENYKMLLKH